MRHYFISNFVYKDPNTGYLISSPSNSPEIGGLVAALTVHQIMRAPFKGRSCCYFKTDEAFSENLK
jgi:alpha-L-fucosidase 2